MTGSSQSHWLSSGMARVLITGSAGGLGLNAAKELIRLGHEVVLHARSESRLDDVSGLRDQARGAVSGDLADPAEAIRVAEEAESFGPFDAVIHNAGVYRGPDIFSVNTVAPYVMTAVMGRPRRIVYLSSGMHRSGSTDLATVDWADATGRPGAYSDSKLYVTALAAAVAVRWPEVASNAVDPGWVPTRMGGPGAPDDLELGHATQVWLALDADNAAGSGGYWFHQQRRKPHPAVGSGAFRSELLDRLEQYTGIGLPE
jgi:NAD(P)-dependent dehydrogenase (short-subunit alcohol dehydrogenase family)